MNQSKFTVPGISVSPSIDDHEMLRSGMRSLFEAQPGMALCGEASTVREALEQLEKLRPDVAILDLQLPDEQGSELTGIFAEWMSPPEFLFAVSTTAQSGPERGEDCRMLRIRLQISRFERSGYLDTSSARR